ncbi:MAG: CaiB/BaiF CoA-transferase family protein [Betaproteobacteria bacterium]
MTRPLDGITVISLEHAIAAPFCTRQLADLGARVIKIERPITGDFARNYDQRVNGMSSHFVWTNRSKESLCLDLKNPKAFEVLLKLLEKADVVVQNLAPGATERLGLSIEKLKVLNPRLIVCDISGYGNDGPYRDKKAYDLLIQSEAGFLSVTGTEGTPSKAGSSIGDISAGMYAYSNILSALILRDRTGEGSHIDVSMLETLSEWMGFPMYYAFEGASPPVRSGSSHATIYPYGSFLVGDGNTIMLGLQNEREWQVFCEKVLKNPNLVNEEKFSLNTKRHENRLQLEKIILDCFSNKNIHEVEELLETAQIANGRLNEMKDLWEHPQLTSRNRWQEIGSPVGPIPALLPPGVNNQFEYRMDSIPSIGQHSEAILQELGYDKHAIQEMRNSQII